MKSIRKWFSQQENIAVPRFRYADLSLATNGFNVCVGSGSACDVYRGTLSDGSIVAVKVMRDAGVFHRELSIMGQAQLSHKNLVRLRGWSHEGVKYILVYDYIPQGHLHRHLSSSRELLTWSSRFDIIKGVAEGLAFLHGRGIIHGDVKASNVFLDSGLAAHLGCFWRAHFGVPILGSEEGNPGFIAPRDFSGGSKFSLQADIYKFGGILLHTASGRKLTLNLEDVWNARKSGKLLDFADPLLGPTYNKEEMSLVLSLGLLCTQLDSNLRPSSRTCCLILNRQAPLPDLPFPTELGTHVSNDVVLRTWQRDIMNVINKIINGFPTNDPHCANLKFLADSTGQYLHLWAVTLPEGRKLLEAAAIGKELVEVLEAASRLLQLYTQENILPTAGEFLEIVDDLIRYSKMMNHLIQGILNGLLDNPTTRQKIQVIKHLEDKMESDSNVLKATLLLAFESYKNVNVTSIATNDLQKQLVLGNGTHGLVYKAQYRESFVAVKEFTLSEQHEWGDWKLKPEVDIPMKMHSLDASHIVQIIGRSEDEHGKKSLVLELMETDLKKLILQRSKGDPFSLVEATDIMLQIAKGMKHLHSNNVIHRDLKPANVLINTRANGRFCVKISDFGTSKDNFKTGANIHTLNQGTLYYMAPEVMEDSYKEDGEYARSIDVYSFGMIFCEIITGNIQFPGTHITEYKKRIKEGKRPILPDLIPNKFRVLVQRCWDQNADRRPTFKEICNEIWSIKEGLLAEYS